METRVQPLWHDRAESPGRISIAPAPRLRRILLAASLLTVTLATAAGLLTWLMDQPDVHFVSCWVTKFRDPTIGPETAADRDRLAIQRGGYFARTDIASMPVHSRFLMQQQLDAVAEESDSDSVVLYVGTYATVDDQGHLVLLSSDFEAGNPESGLPLAAVLQSLAQSPAQHKLLVLDIFAPCLRPGLDAASTNVSAALGSELAAVPDANRLVLCSCSPGQVALESESLQRTVFGYYFEQALGGVADGYNPQAIRDGRVSVHEAAQMLRARVDRWAMQQRSHRQIPVLLGTGADFDLTVCDLRNIQPPAPEKVAKYPAWLLDGWKLRDRWKQNRIQQLSPRVFQTLQASMLRIEHKWRFGGPEAKLKIECEQKIQDLQQLVELSAQQLSGPNAPSLAALLASGHEFSDQAMDATNKVVDGAKTAASSKPADRQAALQKLLVDFDKQTDKIANVDIALAVLQAATTGGPLTPDHLQTLADLLRHRHLSDQWIETRLLNRLAEQASREPPQSWSTRRATQLLRIVQRREQAACRYETMPWMSRLLETTAQSCHDADVYYWAHRYVPTARADQALSAADTSCDIAVAHEVVFVDAQRAYEQAMRTLPWSAEYVIRVPGGATDWNAAVDAAIYLAETLEATDRAKAPTQNPAHGPATTATAPHDNTALLSRQLDAIQKASSNVARTIGLVQQPFSSPAIQNLIRRCQGNDVRSEILNEVDAVLATPLTTAADRVALWSARAKLAHRLHKQIVQLDYHEHVAGHYTSAMAGYDPDVAMRSETSLANLRHRTSLDLLRLAGVKVPAALSLPSGDAQDQLAPEQVSGMSHVWAVTLRNLIEEAKSPVAQERMSLVYPPLKPLPLLDNPSTNPTVQMIARHRKQLWSWSADWYRYETLDGSDPEFYAKLAVQYAPYWRGQTTPALQTNGPTTLQKAESNQTTSTCEIAWTASMSSGTSDPVRIDILNPAAPWLAVTPTSTPSGTRPASPLQLSISLASDAKFTGEIPLGFLVRWRIAGRSFHREIEVPALANQCSLDILLSHSAKPPADSIERITLRPHTPPQPLFLLVQNRGLTPRKVVVELNSGSVSSPVEVGAGQCVQIKFPPPVPKSGPGKESGKQLAELQGPLAVTLLDATNHQKLCSKTFSIEMMEPRQYVDVRNVRFFPVSDEKNRLEIELQPLGNIPGAACPVSLDVSAANVPGLLGVGDGVLKGTLPGNGKPLQLFACDLQLADSVREQGRFHVSVDGVPRTFVFDTTFARRGDPTTPIEAIRPTLRMTAPPKGRSGAPCVVHVEADYAPSNAKLRIEIGRQLSSGHYAWERKTELPSARRRHIGFSPAGKGGALLFEASVSDWDVPIDTVGLVGHRTIQVQLVTDDQHELAVTRQEIVLGNQPPQGVQFVDIPAKAWNGQPLQLTATARQSVPEVSRVVFFLGKPDNDTIPKNAPTAEAAVVDKVLQAWTAQLPLKANTQGKTNVSVQFTNAAGLSSYATTVVDLTDADVSGGVILGSVVEGTIPQRGLEVILKDEKGTEKGKATTATDGSFTFDNLKPGKYELSTSKPTSGRRGSATVTVNDNTRAQTTIELWL